MLLITVCVVADDQKYNDNDHLHLGAASVVGGAALLPPPKVGGFIHGFSCSES